MNKRLVAVFIEAEAWVMGWMTDGQASLERVARVDSVDAVGMDETQDQDTPEHELHEWAQHNASVLNAPEQGAVVLGVNSMDCFSASLPTQGVAVRRREAVLKFRLEAKLPEDIEQLTVRMIGLRSDRVLAVAVVSSVWQQTQERLEQLGIKTKHVVPTALLAASGLNVADGVSLIQTEADHLDLVETDAEGQFVCWRHLPADQQVLVGAVDSNERGVAAACGLSEGLLPGGIGDVADIPEGGRVDDENGLYAATRFAAVCVSGEAMPPVSFEPGGGRGAQCWRVWRPLAAALLVLILASAGLLHHRAERYRQKAEIVQEALRERYIAQFPGERVPAVILPRLRTQLSAALGAGPGDGRAGGLGFDALTEAVDLFKALSAEEGLKLSDLSLSVSSFQMSGQAATLGAVDRLVTSLDATTAIERLGGLQPPATQVMPTGAMGFSIRSSSQDRASGRRP